MKVITLRDYAKQSNISYEAVRKQVVRYQDELAGHLIRDGRQQFLDEEAVAFLDARRQKNPVAIIQMDKNEQIEQLESENKQLLLKLAAVQDALLTEKEKTAALLDEKKGEIALLEADNETVRAKAAKAEENAQKARQELVEAHAAFEEDLGQKNERIQQLEADAAAWKQYAADLEAYNALSKWQRWRQKATKPTPPEQQEALHEQDQVCLG